MREKTPYRLEMLPREVPDFFHIAAKESNRPWTGVVANIYTALTGHLTLIIEKEGRFFALITDIPVAVPSCVRKTAEKASGLVKEELREFFRYGDPSTVSKLLGVDGNG